MFTRRQIVGMMLSLAVAPFQTIRAGRRSAAQLTVTIRGYYADVSGEPEDVVKLCEGFLDRLDPAWRRTNMYADARASWRRGHACIDGTFPINRNAFEESLNEHKGRIRLIDQWGVQSWRRKANGN